MLETPALPIGQTVLLSAGPGAGKTRRLQRWRATASPPAQYLGLTPEDADPVFLLHRWRNHWPAVFARLAERGPIPECGWGGWLGCALSEVWPDVICLLDDLHVLEGTPSEPELLALIRHFPASGTLAIASRHQFPPIGRPHTLWGADWELWQEHPDHQDVLSLPMELQAKVVSLAVAGRLPWSESGWELVRRNVATEAAEACHALRAPWAEAAEKALSLLLPSSIWGQLEEDLRQQSRRLLYTAREAELQTLLQRFPSEIRQQSPFLLSFEGELALHHAMPRQARACFERALTLAPQASATRQDVLLGLARIALMERDWPRARALLLEGRAAPLSPLQQVRILCLEGGLRWWYDREPEAAFRCWQEALLIPAAGDRLLALEQFSARSVMAIVLANRMGDRAEARKYAADMLPLALEYRLEVFVLEAYMVAAHCLQPGERLEMPLERYTTLPNPAFTLARGAALAEFVYLVVRRALMQENDLAALQATECFGIDVLGEGLERSVMLVRLIALGRLSRHREAEDFYQRIRTLPGDSRWRDGLALAWSENLIHQGRHAEAASLLAGSGHAWSEPQLDPDRLVLGAWLQQVQGQPPDLTELQAQMSTPHGALVRERYPWIMRQLGFNSSRRVLHVQALGPLTLIEPGGARPHWPRKIALSLLACLCLHPDGIASERLIEKLFGDVAVVDPSQMLHTAAHSLRQVLKKAVGEDLLESTRGMYRLNWPRIVYCDLHEFNVLYDKAQSLEADGSPAAGLFYELSLCLVRGALFENLPDEFEAERAEYAERIYYARAYLLAHARNPLSTGP